ncbi:MAG: hypothetical protein V4660_17005 [Pseudomonadota bacterium]
MTDILCEEIYIIYTSSNVFLSKKKYLSWYEIQEEYSDYVASLGPWSAEEVIDFLKEEYSDLEQNAEVQVTALAAQMEMAKELLFIKKN